MMVQAYSWNMKRFKKKLSIPYNHRNTGGTMMVRESMSIKQKANSICLCHDDPMYSSQLPKSQNIQLVQFHSHRKELNFQLETRKSQRKGVNELHAILLKKKQEQRKGPYSQSIYSCESRLHIVPSELNGVAHQRACQPGDGNISVRTKGVQNFIRSS